MSRSNSTLVIPLTLASALLLAPAAWAGLGEGAATIPRDHAALRGHELQVTPMQAYDRHELTTASGTTVHEFASRSGTVFAVSFNGPSLPDLKIMLGSHYDEYVAAARTRTGNHHVFTIDSPGLVMHIVKMPRGIKGLAHVPALLPSGVAARDLR